MSTAHRSAVFAQRPRTSVGIAEVEQGDAATWL
jgi:hypothetical protein